MADDPLIISPKAARRLRLLLAHGARLPRALGQVAAAASAAAANDGAATNADAADAADSAAPASPPPPMPTLQLPVDGSLAAALLPEPVTLEPLWWSRSVGGAPHQRDVLAEVAASVGTLQALKVGAWAPWWSASPPPR